MALLCCDTRRLSLEEAADASMTEALNSRQRTIFIPRRSTMHSSSVVFIHYTQYIDPSIPNLRYFKKYVSIGWVDDVVPYQLSDLLRPMLYRTKPWRRVSWSAAILLHNNWMPVAAAVTYSNRCVGRKHSARDKGRVPYKPLIVGKRSQREMIGKADSQLTIWEDEVANKLFLAWVSDI